MTIQTQHTTGPWTVTMERVPAVGKPRFFLRDKNNHIIAIILSQRDVRLINHAPTLLAAAKAALVYVADQSEDGTDGFIDVCEVHRKLRVAIAKVEGSDG